MIPRIRKVAGYALHARPWINGHTGFLLRQLAEPGSYSRHINDTERHLRAAAQWLAVAQDSQPDGGFSGRYRLHAGWSSSYPETTGYLVPTLLALSTHWNEDTWVERARRAIDFLLGVQLPDGSFPGAEIAENRVVPSPFNTAQILNGLTAWFTVTGDKQARSAAERACNWLLGVQDSDGAFRRHFYMDRPATYSTHLSCWIAEYGRAASDERAFAAAARHLDWALKHQDPSTGWFDLAGFTKEQHDARVAFTHTIAYTIWGVLFSSLILDRKDGIAAAVAASEGIMRRFELSRFLPGLLNHKWQAVEKPQCLTGNAQMALIWFLLSKTTGDLRFANAALKAIDSLCCAQDLDNPNPGIRGGLAGSYPIWGSYIFNALPNWAAKFFIDAVLERERFMALISEPKTMPMPETVDHHAV